MLIQTIATGYFAIIIVTCNYRPQPPLMSDVPVHGFVNNISTIIIISSVLQVYSFLNLKWRLF